MAFASNNSQAIKELSAAGIIPAECRRLEISFAVDQAVTIKCERYATPEEALAIAQVVAKYPAESISDIKVRINPDSPKVWFSLDEERRTIESIVSKD